jgi:hypothetical protein
MKRLFLSTICAITALALSQNVFAGTGSTGSVLIQSVSVINVPFGSHKPGNVEIQIRNGFVIPSGVSCDANYITTLKLVDPDGAMLSLLRDARNSNQPVSLWITDNPTYTAYPGRCSIVGVTR